ncbi:MAG: UDP-3-O-(3-hydroxymyristoyl)glucosamine N-acyltransferase [Candidatus Meridianibacter frigidus]|nr:MAG: UDP-3-O-(3-hydroxymyristoyl)glucosamine N-acyltransferase [Candidatus Eremiobacteraeota bacterium]
MALTLQALAEQTGGRVIGDAATRIERVSATEDAAAGSLTFATDERYLQAALKSRASGVLADEKLVVGEREFAIPVLCVPDARVALARVLQNFERAIPRGPFRHASAVVEPSAAIGEDVFIGPLVYVGERATIGARTTLQTGAFVAAAARVGEECVLHQHARVLEDCVLGDRVVLHPGATVGGEGFGWAISEGLLQKIPQVGNAVLGNDVEVGINSCIDRAQTGSTTVGDGTKIDNLVQIGHNCRIGKHCAFAAQVGMAGTTIIGDYVQVGGQAAFKGHITVGSHVIVAGASHVWGNVEDNAFISGRPARAHKEELRWQVMRRKLPKLFARVDALEGKRSTDADE